MRPAPLIGHGGVPGGLEAKLSIRILRRCNFRCPSCSTFSGPEGRGRLRTEDFCAAMDILAAAHFRGVINISGGETTLHPHLPAMLQYGATRLPQARFAVFTNGQWVGTRSWRKRLQGLAAGPNVLLRFSLDRQHAVGLARTKSSRPSVAMIHQAETQRLAKARLFVDACAQHGLGPGEQYDFAFKGDLRQGLAYTRPLGEVPLYLITFRARPERRSKQRGFFAIDIDQEGRALVFPSLGHIPNKESIGGLESLDAALVENRRALEEAAR